MRASSLTIPPSETSYADRLVFGIADCNAALQLQPNDPYAHDNLGIIYLKQADYAKAIAEFNASLKLDAKRARALYGRGLAKNPPR
mgnify:CR=1 FL=1